MNEIIFLFLNNLAGKSAGLDTIFIFFAKYFIYILALSALFFILKTKEDRFEKILIIFGGALLAWLVSQGINTLYPVARPFIALEGVRLLFEHGGYDSFPSGHATFAFALAAGFFYYNKNLAWIFILGAILIGLPRVIAGVHWPADILGALLVGGAIVFLVRLFYKKYY